MFLYFQRLETIKLLHKKLQIRDLHGNAKKSLGLASYSMTIPMGMVVMLP